MRCKNPIIIIINLRLPARGPLLYCSRDAPGQQPCAAAPSVHCARNASSNADPAAHNTTPALYTQARAAISPLHSFWTELSQRALPGACSCAAMSGVCDVTRRPGQRAQAVGWAAKGTGSPAAAGQTLKPRGRGVDQTRDKRVLVGGAFEKKREKEDAGTNKSVASALDSFLSARWATHRLFPVSASPNHPRAGIAKPCVRKRLLRRLSAFPFSFFFFVFL